MSYPDIQIVVDSVGCTVSRKYLAQSDAQVNLIEGGVAEAIQDLQSDIQHLDRSLQLKIINIFQKYPKVLPINGNTGNVQTGELTIRLKKDQVINYRPYRLAPIEREKVNTIVKDLLDKNIIRESQSPYASLVILVKKKGGEDRLCVDYRALNGIIEKDSFHYHL